jgi:hypothetical protein
MHILLKSSNRLTVTLVKENRGNFLKAASFICLTVFDGSGLFFLKIYKLAISAFFLIYLQIPWNLF